MSDEYLILSLSLIAPSLTNPRKSFNEAKLQELAASIKASGVHQPILVRPLPASRLADTSTCLDHATGKQRKWRPAYELVCGERRLRASTIANTEDIPALIRDLTDDQVREIQIVENLQRDDLTELEEAEGYEQLMEHSKLTVDQVGEKIGKSRSYVYGRLKLLNLCPEARTSLREGKIDASRALLVARIPDHKLQIKAMKEIVTGYSYSHGSEPLTYRQALDLLQRNYMLKLSDARFNIKAVDLVPDAGSCKTCTKRTGHDPDLFSDVKGADVCTDPPCFHLKEDAHAKQQVKEAKAKGQTVIAGKEAQELALGGYSGNKFKGYRRLDNAEDSPTSDPLRKIIGEEMKAQGIKPVMIADPAKKGAMVECLPNDVAGKLLKAVEGQAAAAKQVTSEAKNLVAEKKAKAEKKLQDQFEKEWRSMLVEDAWAAIRDDADIKAFDIKVQRFLALRAARNLSTEDRDAVCRILNIGKVGASSGLVDHIKECPSPESVHLLMLMQSASAPDSFGHDDDFNVVHNEALMLVAGNVFNDLEAVIKANKAEAKEKLWPKVEKKAPIATAPAARPKEGPGGSKGKGSASKATPARAAKLSAEEATQGIAAAMQGLAIQASAIAVALEAKPAEVRVGAEIKLHSGNSIAPEFHGSKGRITEIGDGVYMAQIEGHDAPVGLFKDQFDVVAATPPAEPVAAIDAAKYATAVQLVLHQRDQAACVSRLGIMLGIKATMAKRMLERMESEGIIGPMPPGGHNHPVLQPSPIPPTDDPLFQSAVDVIMREQKANVRLLKTELKVGTTKALDLMDQLQQTGKVSACDERGARKVLVAA